MKEAMWQLTLKNHMGYFKTVQVEFSMPTMMAFKFRDNWYVVLDSLGRNVELHAFRDTHPFSFNRYDNLSTRTYVQTVYTRFDVVGLNYPFQLLHKKPDYSGLFNVEVVTESDTRYTDYADSQPIYHNYYTFKAQNEFYYRLENGGII